MSKKKSRGWFVCPQWEELVSRHYADDTAAAHALRTDVKVMTRLRQRTPMARATTLRMLRRYAALHVLDAPVASLVEDTRSR